MDRAFKTALLVSCCVFFSNAATYYVSTAGSDTYGGTKALPFQTIKKGLGAMKAGDTLYIRGGTYHECISSNNQTIPAGTSWANAPVIAAYPGEAVTLDGAGGEIINLSQSNNQYLIFDGGIDHNLILDAKGVQGKYGFSTTNGANHVRLNHFEIKNAGASGVLITYGSQPPPALTGHEFLNGDIHHNGFNVSVLPEAHGFYLAAGGNLIKGCKIHDNAGCNIQIYCGSNITRGQVVNDNIVEGNAIYNGGRYAGLLLSSGSNNRAFNNIIYNNTTGVEVSFDAAATKVYNNTIYNSKGYGVYIGVYTVPVNTEVINNVIYMDKAGPIKEVNGTGTVLKSNLTSDPMFVDPVNGNFQLKPGSLAINAGVNLSAAGVTKDIFGTARPQGSAYDIGAYEYVTGSSIQPVYLTTAQKAGGIIVRSTGLNGIAIGWNGQSRATAVVYTLSGKQVAIFKNVGAQNVVWNTGKSPSGVYLVRVKSGNTVQTARVYCGE